jgi:hypothetical protein
MYFIDRVMFSESELVSVRFLGHGPIRGGPARLRGRNRRSQKVVVRGVLRFIAFTHQCGLATEKVPPFLESICYLTVFFSRDLVTDPRASNWRSAVSYRTLHIA